MISFFRNFLFCLLFLPVVLCADAQNNARPQPSPRQKQWSGMEFYLFVHFGPNTFTDLEWGKGTEKEEVFNPTHLNCEQWCRIAKAAGAKGIIITAKHHDGFCLWPSEYSTHTVKESKWRNGKGDVLKELSDACRKYGLKMGVYLSPWDRNHPKYGTPEYNDVFVNMMKEVVSRYGPFFEFWWDGANGEGPNGKKQVYDWHRFEATMRSIAPNTVVFSDIGPDIRWVGNEKGIAGETNWNKLDTAGFARGIGAPPNDTLNQGNRWGKNWLPAECDVSIRPGWFYHSAEDTAVKTPDSLFRLYLKSVGRGAALLLNVPPDRRGLFTPYDSAALMGFKKLRDKSFSNNLLLHAGVNAKKKGNKLTDGEENTSEMVSIGTPVKFELKKPEALNCILLQEDISRGQAVARFHIDLYNEHSEKIKTINATTIGRKRILSFPEATAKTIEITFDETDAPASLTEVQAFLIDSSLLEK